MTAEREGRTVSAEEAKALRYCNTVNLQALIVGHGFVADDLAYTVQVQGGQIAALASLLDSLVDRDPCWFDHHGRCQAHGFLNLEPGEICPHAQAVTLLAARVGVTE